MINRIFKILRAVFLFFDAQLVFPLTACFLTEFYQVQNFSLQKFSDWCYCE